MSEFLMTESGVALALSTVIFLITIILVITRAIGFWITLLLLLFTLAVGVTVGNMDVVRNYLSAKAAPELHHDAQK